MSTDRATVPLQFSRRELRDFVAAWIALSVAFTVFLNPRAFEAIVQGAQVDPRALALVLGMSLLTVGVGFLLHELGHKVVAIRFGQIAEFRADYGMLGFALIAAPLGILFAAPGAVHHRGRITTRENGLIALAGPLVNLALALVFLGVTAVGGQWLAAIGDLGIRINLLLAAFNMIPFGPLDGRTVLTWSPLVFAVTFAVTAGPALALLFGLIP